MHIYPLGDDFRIKGNNADIQAIYDAVYCVSIGVFDGLHRGHIKVLRTLLDYSKALSLSPAIFTFSRNPKDIFYQNRQSDIIPKAQKYEKLSKLGFQTIFEIDFTENVKATSGSEFLASIFQNYKIAKIVVGKDWKIGNPRCSLGCVEVKKNFPDKIIVVEDEMLDGKKISSTRIRKEVKEEGGLTRNIIEKYFTPIF